MEPWIREYRANHPLAAEWARGSLKVRHTELTQGRVFRMAEQLRVRFGSPNLPRVFAVLRSLDDTIDAETSPSARPAPQHVAAAAAAGYRILFGRQPTATIRGRPSGVDQVEEGEVGLAVLGLQHDGFDAIVIDGLDPAAYLWALFEMQERASSCAEAQRLGEHPVRLPRCVAMIPAAMPPRHAWPAVRETAAALTGR